MIVMVVVVVDGFLSVVGVSSIVLQLGGLVIYKYLLIRKVLYHFGTKCYYCGSICKVESCLFFSQIFSVFSVFSVYFQLFSYFFFFIPFFVPFFQLQLQQFLFTINSLILYNSFIHSFISHMSNYNITGITCFEVSSFPL